MSQIQGTLLPFLYPTLFRRCSTRNNCISNKSASAVLRSVQGCHKIRCYSSLVETNAARRAIAYEPPIPQLTTTTRLNPTPDDYSRSIFVDKCTLTIHAGSGGNGCVAFFRDVHIPDGPPNGGDGGSGGNVWIQAVAGHTSLHKLARRGTVKAGRGIGGQGKSQGGKKGEDICIQVPVGTVIKEIWRSDPLAEEEARLREVRGRGEEDIGPGISRNKWILYPGATKNEARDVGSNLPTAVKPRRTHLSLMQPPAPITLDLDKAMEQPVLLAAGAIGGLGNPHFATKGEPKPKFATKGELGVRIKLELELKLLADVGLVGLPNAGKSTLLRAISNSRTRVGDWAFTTLEPTVGTVVLDTNEGRPLVKSGVEGQPPRTNFTVADIPGLIEDAHLDKGLGLGFLRHIERARILAFVIDLSAGEAVTALQNLWKEVGEYETLRNIEINEETESRLVEWNSFGATGPIVTSRSSASSSQSEGKATLFPPEASLSSASSRRSKSSPPPNFAPISSKPWFVVATKADKDPGTTQTEFARLQEYIRAVEGGETPHPSGRQNAWRHRLAVIPVSAINGEGTIRIRDWTAALLDSLH